MDPFLKRLAGALIAEHRGDLHRVAVVLPGRRAGIFLRKYLAKALGAAYWSPEMLDMGGFMERLTGIRQASSMEMLFQLYRIHQDLMGPEAGSMEDLLQWAPVTLRDMSEVDAHLLDLDNFYRDFNNYHEIEEWSFLRMEPPSRGQQSQMKRWRTTRELHVRSHAAMTATGMGTSGFIARMAAERLAENTLTCPWEKVWFAGLNALEPATTKVIQALKEQGLAGIAWDADLHYLNDPKQEAGQFLRRSIHALGEGSTSPIDAIRTMTRELEVVSVPDRASQARYAAQCLAGLDPEELAATAVVLIEEDLLMPLLEALPSDLGPVNVTMGIPLVSLPVHGLMEAFLNMHLYTGPDGAFRAQDVERLILHPFLHQGETTVRAVKFLRAGEQYFLDLRTICSAADNAGLVHAPWSAQVLGGMSTDPTDVMERSAALLSWAGHLKATDRFAREQLFRMARLHQRVHQELDRAGIRPENLRTYVALRSRLLREERIASFGEPLQGPQIMGLLETRAVDHDRVILLGTQEGSLPRTGADQSWIPFDIRRVHGLPLPSDTASISAYHFHRCLQLASHVHLVHGSSGHEGSAEGSRFIEQWMREVVGNSATTGTVTSRMAPSVPRRSPPIEVEKTPTVLTRLKELADKGFSPSALATYLRCPLDLWMTYGMRIEADQELTDKLGSDVLGNAVHRVMENIHRPGKGLPLEPGALRRWAGEVEAVLKAELGNTYPLTILERGHFRLKLGMASAALKAHLLAEADRCEGSRSIVLDLESELRIDLPSGAVLKGRIDRIEDRDGTIHVLDLKTGQVNESHLKLRSLDRDAIRSDHDKAIQLMCYCVLYLSTEPHVEKIRAGIIPLQKTSGRDVSLLSILGEHDIHRNMLPELIGMIDGLAIEILDADRPFTHDPRSRWCTACVGPE